MAIHSDDDEEEVFGTRPSGEQGSLSCVWVFTQPVVGQTFSRTVDVMFRCPWVGCVGNDCLFSSAS